MKTTPLPEILKQITPLPWKHHLGRGASPRFHIQSTAGQQIASTTEVSSHPQAREENAAREAQAAYLTHAANVLPGLVEAAGDIITHLNTPQSARLTNMAELLESLRQALSLATNVPVNS